LGIGTGYFAGTDDRPVGEPFRSTVWQLSNAMQSFDANYLDQWKEKIIGDTLAAL